MRQIVGIICSRLLAVLAIIGGFLVILSNLFTLNPVCIIIGIILLVIGVLSILDVNKIEKEHFQKTISSTQPSMSVQRGKRGKVLLGLTYIGLSLCTILLLYFILYIAAYSLIYTGIATRRHEGVIHIALGGLSLIGLFVFHFIRKDMEIRKGFTCTIKVMIPAVLIGCMLALGTVMGVWAYLSTQPYYSPWGLNVPADIGVEPTVITAGVPTTITVWVHDTRGYPFEGATVTIEGCSVVEAGTTGSDGNAVFNITAELPPNTIYGSLTVTVRGGYPEVTKTATIVVMKSTT